MYFQRSLNNLAFFALLVITLSSCRKENDDAYEVKDFQKALKAISPHENIEKFESISYKVTGASYEWDEPTVNYPNPINTSNYRYDFISNLFERKAAVHYTQFEPKQPFSYSTAGFNIVINDKKGMISGEYDFKSYFLNMKYPQSLHASRIEALLKTYQMVNPLYLCKIVSRQAQLSIINNKVVIPSIIQGLSFEIEFDRFTYLPLCVRISESDFLRGDIEFKITYDDWKPVSGFLMPSKFHYYLGDRLFRSEKISDIVINPAIKDDQFALGEIASPVTYDTPNGWMGFIYSQWYNRWFDKGLLFDQPLNNGAWILEDHNLEPYGLPSQYVGDNIKIIGRPDHSLYSVAIKTSKGVFIYEPTLNNFWTRSVLNAAKSKFPGQQITGTIVSHAHAAVVSGIREAAYETGNIYVGLTGKDIISKALEAKHSLNPDALSLNPRECKITEISEKTILADGELELYFLNSNSNLPGSHSTDMIIAYVPAYQTIIQSELLWNGPFKRVWVGQAANKYSDGTKKELKQRALFLNNFITKNNIIVKRVISVQGGLGSYEDLLNIINN